jgi:hypothetical protein
VFESSHPFELFDYLRVPYVTARRPVESSLPGYVGSMRWLDDGASSTRRLTWVRSDAAVPPPRHTARVGRFRLGRFTIAGHVYRGDPAPLVGGHADDWRAHEQVLDRQGRPVAHVWEHEDGSLFLPFDPGEVMRLLWSESYRCLGAGDRLRAAARRGALAGYYAVRPALPRATQLRLRRVLAKGQSSPTFPAWPVENSLHDLYDWLLDHASRVAGTPVPWLAPWPDDKSFALVLTHDVETRRGYAAMELLRAEERSRGYRSSWNFVPERYRLRPSTLDELSREGCEVGVHGLRHDGKDLASQRMLDRRLPAIRAYADRWGATGFRSPATQRAWRLMPQLGFDYDSSYTDTDPYEPLPGGCCSYLPFFNGQMVELPITLPQDHTLFEILRKPDGTIWLDKARAVRSRGGMVLVLAHPDYAHEPRVADAWRSLLAELHGDPTMWQALPREVATWWRARAASHLVRSPDGWEIVGPAAGRGRVRIGSAVPPRQGVA